MKLIFDLPNRIRPFTALITIILWHGISFVSAESLDSIDKLLRLAIEQNKSLVSQQKLYQSINSSVGGGSGFPDPVIAGNYFTKPIETRVGAQVSNFKIMQTIPWPYKLSSLESAEKNLSEVYKYKYLDQIQRLKLNIETDYLKALELAKLIQLNVQHIQLVNELYEITIQKIKVGSASQSNALYLSVELSTLTQKKLQLRSNLSQVLNRLENLTGEKLSEAQFFTEVDYLNKYNLSILNHFGLKSRKYIKTHHPLVLASLKQVQRNISLKKSSNLQAFPDITLNATWYQIEENKNDLEDRDAFSFGAQISLPLFSSKYVSRQEKAEHSVEQSKIETEDKIDQILTEIENNVTQLKSKNTILKIYKESINPNLSQAIEFEKSSYRQGKATINSIIDAIRKKIEHDTVQTKEKTQAKILIAQIKRHIFIHKL